MRNYYYIFYFIVGFSLSSYAVESLEASAEFLQVLSSSEGLSEGGKKSDVNVTLQSEFESYPNLNRISTEGKAIQQSSFVTNRLGFSYSKDMNDYHNHIDLSALYITESSYLDSSFYLDLAEAYSSRKLSNNWSLSAGRKKYNWSWADKFFDRGVWQPQWNWNQVRQRSQGLMGVFLESPPVREGFHWVLFASSGIIPSTGSRLRAENGALSYNSPWSSPPPRALEIFGQQTLINYKVTQPSVERVLLRSPGVATKIEWKGKGIQWGGSFAYKPMNKAYIHTPVILRLGDKAEDFHFDINLHGTPHYHQVLGQELQWNMGSWDMKLDWTYENLDSFALPKESIGQNVSSTNIYTFLVSRRVNQRGGEAEFFASHSYLDGQITENIGDVNVSKTILPSRYSLTNTTMVGVNQPLSLLLNSRVKSDLTVAYDWDQRGLLLKSSLGVQLNQKFLVYLQADIVGSLRNESARRKSGLMQSFTDADTVRVGGRYDF